MSEATEPTVWGEIDGRTITFPMEVTDFDAATFVFSVPADAAQRLLPGDDFQVIEIIDGIAQMVIALCDYHENPWGDYLEINLGFLARPAGASEDVIGSFVYRMPVDQEFTCKAGNDVMGFPKTVQDLYVSNRAGRIRFGLDIDGRTEFAISFSEPLKDGAADRIDTISYSYLGGRPYETPLAMDMGAGEIDARTVEVELGDGLLAEELKSLGFPKAPDFGSWGTKLTATFQLGHPVRA